MPTKTQRLSAKKVSTRRNPQKLKFRRQSVNPQKAKSHKAVLSQPLTLEEEQAAYYARSLQLSMPFLETAETVIEAQPFLKWVGGKASLLKQLDQFLPQEIDRYLEPFLGGGAVFFHLKHRFPKLRAFLSDSNKELINCYRIVRDRPEELMERLDDHSQRFRSKGDDYYYAVRQQHDLTNDLARAARMIFLNKTCYNGLWRVNARSEFNTPVGSNKSPSLYSRANLLAAAAALQGSQIEVEDFRSIVSEARRGDFIYFDPPYFPISVNSDFKRYTQYQFHETDQIELANVYRALDAKGCQVVLSNSEHPRIRELYDGYGVSVVSAPRFINCRPGGRGNVTELVISNSRSKQKVLRHFMAPAQPTFPDTKYMGSKQRLLPFIMKHLEPLKASSVLDAFSGSGCVGYALKQTGARVYANDFLKFCFHTARATIENNATSLNEDDVSRLLRKNRTAPTFVRDTYTGLFFDEDDCTFLDNLWANILELDSPLKTSLALAAAARACMKKRPRGLFTFTGKKGWDGRADLKLRMSEQFLLAVNAFNSAVFSNGQQNQAFNHDVFDLDPTLAEVVYIDTPYISPFSDCDYTRRYHFVEGYVQYWKDLKIMEHTSTKKIHSYKTDFATKSGATQAFRRLFSHFRDSTLVVSYSSNCIPNKAEMIALLQEEKKRITVFEVPHRYHHGNHAHKVGDNMNKVAEYLFIAQ